MLRRNRRMRNRNEFDRPANLLGHDRNPFNRDYFHAVAWRISGSCNSTIRRLSKYLIDQIMRILPPASACQSNLLLKSIHLAPDHRTRTLDELYYFSTIKNEIGGARTHDPGIKSQLIPLLTFRYFPVENTILAVFSSISSSLILRLHLPVNLGISTLKR